MVAVVDCCLDVGATKIAAGIVSGGAVRSRLEMSTPKDSRRFLETLATAIERVSAGTRIKAIKIGAAGVIDARRGVILKSPNLPFRDVAVAAFLKKRFKRPVAMANDANCFALGELYFGAGRRFRDFACLTVGTGLGSALVLGKQLYLGRGYASEFGHTVVAAGGIRCGCGNLGCIESYVSERSFERLARQRFGRAMDARRLAELARRGNKKAAVIFSEVGRWLGIGLANLANSLDLEAVIIGGGISKVGELLLSPARKSMRELLFVPDPPAVLRSRLKNATLLGASKL